MQNHFQSPVVFREGHLGWFIALGHAMLPRSDDDQNKLAIALTPELRRAMEGFGGQSRLPVSRHQRGD